jgi:hypothetical protein
MNFFTGVELTKNQLLHFLFDINVYDLKQLISININDFNLNYFDTNNFDFEIFRSEYNIKLETIDEVKNIYNNLLKISKNPHLILTNVWDKYTQKVIDSLVKEYIEEFMVDNYFCNFSLTTLVNKNKYYVGFTFTKSSNIINFEKMNSLYLKNIGMFCQFKTKFYFENILSMHESLQEKINNNLINIIIEYTLINIYEKHIEFIIHT